MKTGVKRVIVFLCAALVLVLARVPAFRVNEAVMIVAGCLLSALLYVQCRLSAGLTPFLQAVGLALLAWMIDLSDGAASVVYGAVWVSSAWCYRVIPPKYIAGTAFGAACASYGVGVLGTTLVMILGRAHMSLGGALIFSLEQQLWQALSCLAGGYGAGLILHRHAPAA